MEDTRDVGLRGQPDLQVWVYAQAHSQTIITYDREFGDDRVYPLPHAGIILGDQIDHLSPATQIRLVIDALAALTGQSLANILIIVAPGRIRIHRRPPTP